MSSNGQVWQQQYGVFDTAITDISEWKDIIALPGGLPKKLTGAASATVGDKVYLIGGVDETGTATANVYVATIDVDGNLGDYTLLNTLPQARFGCSVFVSSSRVCTVQYLLLNLE